MSLCIGSILTSCILENDTVNGAESLPATLRVEVAEKDTAASAAASAASLRSSSFNEDHVEDLHVAVYNSQGTLTGHAYSSGGAVTLTTRSGEDCTVYALVNTGNEDFTIPATQDAFKALTTESITTPDGVKVNNNLLMSGSLTTDITAGDNTLTDALPVTRLAARNILYITCGEGITLTGYAIKNLPVKSRYAARPNTLETTASDDAVGDDAVDPDIPADWLDTETFQAADILTGTGTLTGTTYALTFYQYENRRGGRVAVGGTTGDASDYTQKAVYAPEKATYIEFYVNAGGTAITYRLYLGADASNYNVKRNGSYTYNIFIGASGMNVSSVGIAPWTDATTETETEL